MLDCNVFDRCCVCLNFDLHCCGFSILRCIKTCIHKPGTALDGVHTLMHCLPFCIYAHPKSCEDVSAVILSDAGRKHGGQSGGKSARQLLVFTEKDVVASSGDR